VTHCTFSGNTAGSAGSGMYNDEPSSLIVTHCTLSGNTAGSKGGGMYNYKNSSPIVTHCTFSDNTAGADGGGVYSRENSSPTFDNCTFSSNGADDDGGGIYNEGGGLMLTNCTFGSNRADDGGGGIYDTNLTLTLANCILWANRDASGTGTSAQVRATKSDPVVTYSCIQDEDPDDADIPFGGATNGNIDDDPLFARNPDPGPDGEWDGIDDDFGNLRLLPGSPCVDAGDNTAVPADVTDLDGDGNVGEPTPFDLAGGPRFQDDPGTADTGNGTPPIVDMGAYEGPALPALLRIVGGPGAVDSSATLVWPKAEGVGLDAFEIAVDQAVSLVGSSVVTSGGASTPAVSAFTHIGAGVHRVDLTEPIPVGHWTIITLTVAGITGGESTFELSLGHLPADINGDGQVDMSDATDFGLLFNADPSDPQRDRVDLNADGQANLNDVTLFGQLWQGTSGHDAWQGVSLPPKP